jgi:hypothetical protein
LAHGFSITIFGSANEGRASEYVHCIFSNFPV